MAYTKKATAYVLDCSPSMGITLPNHDRTTYQEAKDMIISKLEDRILAGRKTDQTSVILAGTEGTDNIVASEKPGQYQHVTTLSDICQPDLALVRKLDNVQILDSEDWAADMFDAIIVSIEVIRKHCRHLKYDKHIQVITTLDNEIDWLDTEAIQAMLKRENISITAICVGLDDTLSGKNNPSERQKMNAKYWEKFIEGVADSELVDYEPVFTEMQRFRKKEVRPTPTYRGYLHLGDPATYPDTSLAISVNMYAQVYEAKIPTAKKWSAISRVVDSQNESGQSGHQVEMEKKYAIKRADEGNDEGEDTIMNNPVDEKDIQKAYRFGKTLITVSEEVEDYLKLHTEPEMTILGFYHSNAIPRDYLMSNVYVITAGSYNSAYAGTAISVLAQTLRKMSAVALVRHVSRANVPPKLAVLYPHFAENVDALHFVQVAYGGGVRQFTFNSLDKALTASGKVIETGHPYLPTKDVEDGMKDLIDTMDIEALGQGEEGHEYLDPEETYNPRLWLVKKAITTRALRPAAPIPDIDPRLVKQLEPIPKLLERSQEPVSRLKRLLNIKQVDPTKKKRRYAVNDQVPGEGHGDRRTVEDIVRGGEQGNKGVGSLLQKSRDVREISMANPVADFEDMVKNMNEDLVSEAVTQMTKMILQLVTTSFGDRQYGTAMDCLKVLRSTAAKENESEDFNRFMIQLKNACDPGNPQSRRLDFWNMMKKENITLITNEDAPDSEVTPEEAETYLKGVDNVKEVLTSTPMETREEENELDEDEDLFAMME